MLERADGIGVHDAANDVVETATTAVVAAVAIGLSLALGAAWLSAGLDGGFGGGPGGGFGAAPAGEAISPEVRTGSDLTPYVAPLPRFAAAPPPTTTPLDPGPDTATPPEASAASPAPSAAVPSAGAEGGAPAALPGDPARHEAARAADPTHAPERALERAPERASSERPPAEAPAQLAGIWAPNERACSPRERRNELPAVINTDGAFAGETSCAFRKGRRSGNAWTFAATCSNGRTRWNADVRIVVSGNRLTWTSQRGTQSYVRCEGGSVRAEAVRRPADGA